MSNSPTLFTKIISGDIPSYKIYEDDKTYAFLDIHPVQPGHVLVVPKTEVEFLWDLPEEYYRAVMATCQKVALRIREVLAVKYVGEQVIGIDVPHAHVHLIPFNTPAEYHNHPDMNAQPDHTALAELAKRLAF